jgi:hypothetical protein
MMDWRDGSSGKGAGVAESQLRYQEICEDHYAQEAAASFCVQPFGEHGVLLEGPCPRCHGPMTFLVADLVYRGASTPDDAPAAPSSAAARPVVMLCTVDREYSDRPPGRVGCGAYWAVTM